METIRVMELYITLIDIMNPINDPVDLTLATRFNLKRIVNNSHGDI